MKIRYVDIREDAIPPIATNSFLIWVLNSLSKSKESWKAGNKSKIYLLYSNLICKAFFCSSFLFLDSYIKIGIETRSARVQNTADSTMNLFVLPLSSLILQTIDRLSTNQYKKKRICPRTLNILNALSSSSNKMLTSF